MKRRLTIGSRGSRLALWQSDWAKQRLEDRFPDVAVEVVTIKTKGDRMLRTPFSEIGGKGVFTKEIEEALLDTQVDLAVHSLKDLPTKLPDGLSLGAVSSRVEVRDALVSRNGATLDLLSNGATVGTSSVRRQAQLLHVRPDLEVKAIRGNVETRLRKLEEEDLGAVLLAAAGLIRLDLAERITELIPCDRMVPAPGQGALGIEIRQDDGEIQGVVSAALDDDETRTATTVERSLLAELGGGCQVPIGAWARIVDGQVRVDGVVATLDGRRLVRAHVEGSADDPVGVGRALADRLREKGAEEILSRFTLEG